MPKIIKNTEVVEDNYSIVTEDTDLGSVSGDVIVPLAIWSENKDAFANCSNLGLLIPNDTDVEALGIELDQFALVALDFPQFVDGRAYSQARILRTRVGYEGALRATGDVLHDQLFFMQRCGFDEYAVREDKNIEAALDGLNDFTVKYQSAVDEPVPHFAKVYK